MRLFRHSSDSKEDLMRLFRHTSDENRSYCKSEYCESEVTISALTCFYALHRLPWMYRIIFLNDPYDHLSLEEACNVV